MLQTVLGLDAARIAAAFLDSPAAMAQRLVRAKQRIREQGLRFDLPERGEWPARLGAVLAAVYAAFGAGCADIAGADPNHQGLAGEGLFLARLLAELLPKEPEALGLAALALTVAARRPAGRDAAGRFVPLSRQDPGLWLAPLLAEAEALLAAAARFGRPGRYQLEAAIHAAHAARPRLGHTPWPAIRLLYGALVAVSPTAGALVGQAAALAECEGPAAGLAALASLPSAELAGYQPYHALRAHLLARQGQAEAAAQARQQALGLTVDPAVRAFLLGSAGQGEPTPATAR
jgi:RNA polymerase sigma-70 factor (ECF subfamily)